MSKNVLIVLTSHNRLGDTGKPTGYWKEEFSTPYYVLVDAGANVTLSSPKGGEAPVDPGSAAEESASESTRRLDGDPATQQALKQTVPLADVDAADFDAVFYPGGHGPLWDLVSDEHSIRLIEAFWRQQKPVSAVCHGPIALANAKDDDGHYIVKGRAVSGFTDSEEKAVGLLDVVPYRVEKILTERGGLYKKGEDFTPFCQVDQNLITGQNPQSSEAVVNKLLEALDRRA